MLVSKDNFELEKLHHFIDFSKEWRSSKVSGNLLIFVDDTFVTKGLNYVVQRQSIKIEMDGRQMETLWRIDYGRILDDI